MKTLENAGQNFIWVIKQNMSLAAPISTDFTIAQQHYVEIFTRNFIQLVIKMYKIRVTFHLCPSKHYAFYWTDMHKTQYWAIDYGKI